ncbi:hypothetical protein ABID21_001502 [Pseudorhizobium tarimense]|uniref:Glucosamine inositolphosphorylceramide transferase 1 N-terminal domain-containing protein n=1 Tax=Pseudorhizobium tarimense TaxID=1079109 RepID=A0ABV2H4D5_9HYPH|nr:hypothetical protein [Pseudorhizobium tarimense]MCJ8518622.1 hypothetical protein [Pseudorhizobium tarimense]
MDASVHKRSRTSGESPLSPLRIGLLTDRRDGFENWQLALIDRIAADDRLLLDAVVLCPSKLGEISAFFRFAAAMERETLGRQPNYHLKNTKVQDLPFITLEAHLAQDSGTELDLVLSISPLADGPEAFCSSRFGSWHLSFLDAATSDVDWFGYQEVMGGIPATEVRLAVRRDGVSGHETVAVAGFNTKFSAVRSGDFIKERAVTLVMRELRKIAETGILLTSEAPPLQAAQPPRVEEWLSYAAGVARNLVGRGRRAVKARFGRGAPPWALFVGEGSPKSFDPRTAVLLKPENDELRADPFLLEHEGHIYLFYEAYTPREAKAHIAVGRLVGDQFEQLGMALAAEHHLSYPFVFRHAGGIFMVPETHEARRLEVWRCVEFPLRWELHATALEGQSSADSTLFAFDGRWWLFTNLSEFHAYEDHCSELHLFEVDGPDLKWMKPHRHNPVVIGSTEARNGGRPFEHDGRLYRPSQRNERGIYGYGLNLMEVEQLNLETYRERRVRTIKPDFAPGLLACHHMDATGGRYVIDAMFADQSSLLR